MKIGTSEFNSIDARQALENLITSNALKLFLEDFEIFSHECSEKSEICLYFENYLQIMRHIKNLINADQRGDFLLHINSVGELCNVFTGGDGIHYQRYASFHHKQLKGFKNQHPKLYDKFLAGEFVVKTKGGPFNADCCCRRYEAGANNSKIF